jgi:cold shock CspA family protein
MLEGTVRMWKSSEGYGFIEADDGGPDVFVHQTAIEMEGYRYLALGERVVFESEAAEDSPDGSPRRRATSVSEPPGRLRGTVAEFDDQKGFGFIEAEDGERLFLHYSDILGVGTRHVSPGEVVTFSPEEGSPDRKARWVKPGDQRPELYQFAQFPRQDEWLPQLAELAEPEHWGFKHDRAGEGGHYPVLHSYVIYTFAKLKEQADEGGSTIAEKEVDGREYACFDTGLATPQQQHIYALFEKNLKPELAPWYWRNFCTLADRPFPWNSQDELPGLAEYFEDPAELMYDRRADLKLDYEHILEDHLEDRFPDVFQGKPALARNALMGAEAQIKDRVYRNYKTAVPQYWRGRVQLLLPLCLQEDGKADLALVVQREEDRRSYRGNTVLTLDMAYSNARLLARPDRDWLKPEEVEGGDNQAESDTESSSG